MGSRLSFWCQTGVTWQLQVAVFQMLHVSAWLIKSSVASFAAVRETVSGFAFKFRFHTTVLASDLSTPPTPTEAMLIRFADLAN